MGKIVVDRPGMPAGTTLGRYRVLAELGRGGMGVVYRAEDRELGRHVALKVLPPGRVQDEETLTRFKREGRALASLNHPCIIALYGVEEIDGQIVLAMELAEGKTLAELIPEGGVSRERIFRLAIPFADALAAAHARGVVHRDLKPSNVVVTPAGRIKILDFGLAKWRADLADPPATHISTEPLTAPGSIAGTAGYMAPEQIRGKPADERSDIFAAGILFYEMATGRHPFRSPTDRAADVASSILRDDPPPVDRWKPELPHHLDRILRCCLEKDPERRFQSAKDLRNQLETLEKELASAAAATAAARPETSSDRHPGRLALWALLAAVALGAGYWGVHQLGRPPPPPADPVHLAVSEFRGLSGDTGLEYFRSGFVSVLAEGLADLEGVWLVPPGGDPVPDFQVKADVRRLGRDITLLIEVEDRSRQTRLGNEILRGSADSPYALVADAGEVVAGLLRREAGLPVSYRASPAPTADPEAFDLYLLALARGAASEEGEPEPALVVSRRAVERDAGFAPAWILVGELELARWRSDRRPELLDSAGEACRRALAIDPGRAAAHLCMARVHAARERLLEAEEEYTRSLELDPTAMEAYTGLSDVFQELGHPDRGERTWRRLVALHPGYWGGYYGLGYFFYNSDRYEPAIEQYSHALELAPDNARVHLRIGAAYHVLGRYEEAILAYERSLQVRPNFGAYTNLGTLYLLFRRFPHAVESYERAVELPEASYVAYGSLATAYFWAEGHRSKAAELFEEGVARCREALARQPHDPDPWFWLAYDLAMLGRKAESLAALESALRLRPHDDHDSYFVARIFNRLGDPAQSLDWLERAVEGGYPRAEIRLSIEFDDLRDDPRFRRLLESG